VHSVLLYDGVEPETATGEGPSGATASPCAHSLDLSSITPLLRRIEAQYHPEQIWLFGSRARGEAGPHSDWDLFVVVPDSTPDEQLDPLVLWRLTRGSGVPVDVLACRTSEFREACDTVNTLAYVVAREGVRLDDR
jgi:predicted nucleotidyltransferase